jgi:dUTP pyrophosphatase
MEDVSIIDQETVEIPVSCKNLEHLPQYASLEAAGADLRAAISEPLVIAPGAVASIPTGLSFEIPVGFEGQIRPRSGLALKFQVTVLNAPGTIDSDFRGEVCVILINHGKTAFTVLPSMRIAQIIIAPIARATFVPSSQVKDTSRGAGGFGHTGFF